MIYKIYRRCENMRIWMLNVLNRMLRNEFECWNNSIAQSHHHSSLNWMTVLQTCCIFCEFERHKFRFDWRQCKIECLENEIEWQMGCAWPKSSKLNAHKINLVDKITKLTGKTYTKIIIASTNKYLCVAIYKAVVPSLDWALTSAPFVISTCTHSSWEFWADTWRAVNWPCVYKNKRISISNNYLSCVLFLVDIIYIFLYCTGSSLLYLMGRCIAHRRSEYFCHNHVGRNSTWSWHKSLSILCQQHNRPVLDRGRQYCHFCPPYPLPSERTECVRAMMPSNLNRHLI